MKNQEGSEKLVTNLALTESLTEAENTNSAGSGKMVTKIMNILSLFLFLSMFPAILLREHRLWISCGKTICALPFYQALRVVRKHEWELVNVEPIRRITRWQAFKILIKGDELPEKRLMRHYRDY